MTEVLLHSDLAPLAGIAPDDTQAVFARFDAAAQPALDAAGPFLASVFAAAPYLRRLARRRPHTLTACVVESPESLIKGILRRLETDGRAAPDVAGLDRVLRRAKADAHLVTALADLSGAWSLAAVTGAMTRLADACVRAALEAHVRLLAERGKLLPVADPDNPLPGLFVMALGKMGTGDLNYSSDIDLVVFYDGERLALPDSEGPRQRLPRLVQAVSRSLQTMTEDGYVFRVDLRLRPDPGATPVVISTDSALNYYESMGQTWERAAWIKARACAGDVAAAQDFLRQLQPFIWRRSLDYAAIDDIRGLARQIQTVGRRAEIHPPGHDLKLGRGGIREIEFFAQIPQLVFGGRDERQRLPSTLEALGSLAEAGIIDARVASELSEDYCRLRNWEHRIQMREDEPSQTLPEDAADRRDVARLAGFADLGAFEAEVEACLQRVHGHFSDQFEDDEPLASRAGSLILTGVEPTPDTLKTLEVLGFSEPEQAWKRLNSWAAGRVRAVRSPRARTLFSRIAPGLVDQMAETGEPDAALVRFAAFFENLPMGVQPLSLLSNEPGLAADLVAVLTLAPRLASDLARRPNLIDAMMDENFAVPIWSDAPDRMQVRMRASQARHAGHEDKLNAARRIVREEKFRVGAQILRGTANAETAGRAFTDIADASIEAMALAAEQDTARKHGPAPGAWAIVGLGKLGGRELAADSDLDVMIVHDGEGAAQAWFGRFAQRLIRALSAPTEEGSLYEIDMQLRPSGKAGPVAVMLSRLEPYYRSEAWTWELMALTRARLVAGDPALCRRIEALVDGVLAEPRDPAQVRADALAMRRKLEEAKPARSPWDLKARAGGLQDIEFIVQTLQLTTRIDGEPVQASTRAGLEALAAAGTLSARETEILVDSLSLYLGVMQLIRVAHGSGFDPAGASAGFAARLADLAGKPDLQAVATDLDARATQVRALFERHVGRM
ncbi:bifunctional [glutamine synthetase] adenylyltransferase/[glutamine synthetase]-adenylyl-L-tyrosine phosphorylase [Maricaulis sp. CAU 1757]